MFNNRDLLHNNPCLHLLPRSTMLLCMISGDQQINNNNLIANQKTIPRLIIQQHLNLFKETNKIQAHKQ
jgi:hypothetical protein